QKPPRPPNAFILYRRAKQPLITKERGKIPNAMISKLLAKMWRNETEEEKLRWRKLADRKKMEHMQANPGYVYRPK
ncbi:high mobility group box protein, partial [Glomus cerebriforme]